MNRDFEIWVEGYAATGEKGTAQKLGIFPGGTFKEACLNALLTLKWDMDYYNFQNNTYWGCRLFDNETDAKKNYG